MTLRTIQVVQHLSPGGIETMALDLLQFAPDPDNCYIISLQGDKEALCQRWPRLQAWAHQLICLNKPPGIHWSTLKQLSELFKQLKPDVVHTHHIGPLLYGGIAARMAKVKNIIHTEHDAWHLQSRKRRTLERGLLKLVKPVLVADAHVVAAELVSKLKVPAPVVIQNGIDTERFKPGDKASARAHFAIPRQAIVIGCAARLIAVKGHKILLGAMKNLPEAVHLVLAGDGEEHQALKQYVAAELDPQRIHFLGNIDDMPAFYQAIDIFCLPSFKEGFPLSPLEAQAAGVPVVASDIGGMKETLCPNTGSLVDAGNVTQLSESLMAVIKRLYNNCDCTDVSSLANFMHQQEKTAPEYAETMATIRTLQQTIRNFVTDNNDVRQMASRYHEFYSLH